MLNSSYFEDGKIEYLPSQDPKVFREKCKKRKVSLEPEKLEEETQTQLYEEWMLPCIVEPIADEAPFIYYVSRAYNSHLAFVYIRHYQTKEWHLINISERISVLVDPCVEPHCISF